MTFQAHRASAACSDGHPRGLGHGGDGLARRSSIPIKGSHDTHQQCPQYERKNDPSEAASSSGAGGRDNIGTSETTHATNQAAVDNTHGNGQRSDDDLADLPPDEAVKLADVKRRFEVKCAARPDARTRKLYWRRFVVFAECEHLDRFSPRVLAGEKGAELIVTHWTHISERSRTQHVAAIKKIWTRGIGIAWPDIRDDLPRPSPARRMSAPRRELVEQWVKAVRNEESAYVRSWLLVEANGGLRPIDQQAELRVEDLVFDPNGLPVAINAEAARHPGFKRPADIRQHLALEVGTALKEWLGQHPGPTQQAFVWPGRDSSRRCRRGTTMTTTRAVVAMRRDFQARHRLQWLTSKDFRHFVRTVLNDAGMPVVERHYWQGHSPNLSNMDERYGDRPFEESVEIQRSKLPQGPLGVFVRVERDARSELPAELRSIWERVTTGEIDAGEAGDELARLVRTLRRGPTHMSFVTP